MRYHLIATLVTAGAIGLATAACTTTDEVGSDSANATEWATTQTKDEAYDTQYVIAEVCERIYGAGYAADSCKQDHVFRLIESKVSTKYGYLKENQQGGHSPLEVGQTLLVTAPDQMEHEATLLRQFDQDFHLRWTVQAVTTVGGGPPLNDIHGYIEDIAYELGEYVDFGDSPNVVPTTWEGLPSQVQLSCEATLLANAEMNSEAMTCPGSADWMEDGFAKILYEGQPVGYICGIEDILYDCPLHDGSGVWLFLDDFGEVVVETQWTG